jgi:hypothetical protein
MSTDPSVRRIQPQDAHDAQAAQMSSFQFAPQQFPQRETQKSQLPHLPFFRSCDMKPWIASGFASQVMLILVPSRTFALPA